MQQHVHTTNDGVIGGPCRYVEGDRECGKSMLSYPHVSSMPAKVRQVRPPDEDYPRNPRTVTPTEFSAAMARQINERLVGKPWQVAARALRAGEDVESGPWPVRMYVGEDAGRLVRQLRALLLTAEEFSINSWWSSGRRVVLVTWGELDGLAPAVCADEIEKAFGG